MGRGERPRYSVRVERAILSCGRLGTFWTFDRLKQAKAKMGTWTANGAQFAWSIYSDAQTVYVDRRGNPMIHIAASTNSWAKAPGKVSCSSWAPSGKVCRNPELGTRFHPARA